MNVDETPGSPESPWAQKWWCTTAFSHCHQNQYAHISSIQTYSNCISGDVCKTRQHESPAPNQASVFWFALISNQNKSQVRMMDHALYVVRYLVLGGYLFHTVTNVCIFVCVCVLHLTPSGAVLHYSNSWIPCRHGTGEAVNEEASKTAPWVDSRDGDEDIQKSSHKTTSRNATQIVTLFIQERSC